MTGRSPKAIDLVNARAEKTIGRSIVGAVRNRAEPALLRPASSVPPSRRELGALDDEAPLPEKPGDLDPAALYGPIGNWVRALGDQTEAHPAPILAQALVYFGIIVGRGPVLQIGRDRHHANEFALVIGQTSDSKGQSWSDAREVFRHFPSQILPAPRYGLTSDVGLAYHVRDERDKDPGVRDKRLLVVETEFSAVLVRARRDANPLSQAVRQAWDDGNLGGLSKNDPTTATDAHIGIIGHITPADMRAHLSQTDMANGFGNRFLLFWTERQRDLPRGGLVPIDVVQHHTQQLIRAATVAEGITDIRFSAEAGIRYDALYGDLRRRRPGTYGLMTQRAAPHVCRLAMIYALADCTDEIRVEHLGAALALWQYADASAKYLFPPTVMNSGRSKLIHALEEAAPARVSRNALHRAFGSTRPADELDAELSQLREEGRVDAVKEPTGGRTREMWGWLG